MHLGLEDGRNFSYTGEVSNINQDFDLVVAEDGSIPRVQLVRMGLKPGSHLRVVEARRNQGSDRLEGSLTDFPEITGEDFDRASSLAIGDLHVS